MEQDQRLLLKLDGETSHEVDSIVECRGPLNPESINCAAGTGIAREQQFKLEMCCECCRGRRIQLSCSKLLQGANEPLRDLAMQTI